MDAQLIALLTQIAALTAFAGGFTTVLVEGVKRALPAITPLQTNLGALVIALLVVFLALAGIEVNWTVSTGAMGVLASILVFGTSVGIHEIYNNFRR